jgi:hypothetical protein
MPISVGDPVELTVDRVSVAGGDETLMQQGRKGRVCRDYGNGLFCVRFIGIGCRRLRVQSLQRSAEPAPLCTSECTTGC